MSESSAHKKSGSEVMAAGGAAPEPYVSSLPEHWTIGTARLGVSDPVSAREVARGERESAARETCAKDGHPAATYHPQLDRSWCYCGAATYPGDHDHDHSVCCGPESA